MFSFSFCQKTLSETARVSAFILLFVVISFSGAAQTKQSKGIDHLTVAEDELVHTAQELDKRTEIFIKAIDRRFQVLNQTNKVATNDNPSKPVKKEKNAQDWGELPSGTHTELLDDIRSILNEAVRNIDNAAEHNAKNSLLPKSLNLLAEASTRFREQLKLLGETTLSETDRRLAEDIAETARQIIEAQKQHADVKQ
jgi:hypothetical protein